MDGSVFQTRLAALRSLWSGVPGPESRKSPVRVHRSTSSACAASVFKREPAVIGSQTFASRTAGLFPVSESQGSMAGMARACMAAICSGGASSSSSRRYLGARNMAALRRASISGGKDAPADQNRPQTFLFMNCVSSSFSSISYRARLSPRKRASRNSRGRSFCSRPDSRMSTTSGNGDSSHRRSASRTVSFSQRLGSR